MGTLTPQERLQLRRIGLVISAVLLASVALISTTFVSSNSGLQTPDQVKRPKEDKPTSPAVQIVTPPPTSPLPQDRVLDFVDLYAEYVANPEATREKYKGKILTARGIVDESPVTIAGVLVCIRHSRDPLMARYRQDRITAAFLFGQDWDMGFDWRFGSGNSVIVPWRELEPITVKGAMLFGVDQNDNKTLTITVIKPKLQ